MTESTSQSDRVAVNSNSASTDNTLEVTGTAKPKDSYVKLAMRNMVRKGRQSLWHFFLTTVGLVGLLVGLAYLTKP